MTRRIYRNTIFALLSCFVPARDCEAGNVLMLQGFVIGQPMDGQTVYTNAAYTNVFTAWMEKSRIRIHVRNLWQNAPLECLDYLCDGSNSCTCSLYSKTAPHFALKKLLHTSDKPAPIPLEIEAPTEEKPRNDGTAIVNATPVPDYDPSLTPLWLALYGGWYYGTRVDNVSDPVFPVGAELGAGLAVQHRKTKTTIASRMQAGNSVFLAEFSEFQPAKLFRLKDYVVTAEDWPRSFKQKVLNARYETLSWLTLDGMKIPQLFQAEKYTPDLGSDKEGEVTLITRFTGTITNAEYVSTNISWQVSIPASTRVIDNRLADDEPAVPAIVYFTDAIGQSGLPSLKQLKGLDGYKREIRQLSGTLSPATRIAAYLFMFAALIIPPLIWIRTLVRRKHASQQT
jgi:hypothetical protein